MSKVKENKEAKEWYKSSFESFEKKLNGHSESFLHKFRKDSLSKFEEFNFPTIKNEEWKYTNISKILKHNFEPAVIEADSSVSEEEIAKNLFPDFECNVMVFINGVFNKEFSKLDCLAEGVIIDSLENVLKNHPGVIEGKISQLSKVDNSFNALNGAFALHGTCVYVPSNTVVPKPIQVLYLNGAEGKEVLSLPRNIIIAEENAQVSVINSYKGRAGSTYFTNAVTEVFAEKNSVVDIYKIQDENLNSYHIEKVDAVQKKGSVLSHYSLSFGGSIVRNDVNILMDDENIESNFYGLYLANEDQHVDHHTFADHAKANCVSNELYKGILDGRSRGVFNGKIMVREDAQKTNAYQSNKTVLLSDEARIDTKPQLEIFADDVKCSHGATVGHLDDDAYFYIRSRGIPSEIAKSMLIRAFVSDVVEKVKIPELREQINHMIFEHLRRVEI